MYYTLVYVIFQQQVHFLVSSYIALYVHAIPTYRV